MKISLNVGGIEMLLKVCNARTLNSIHQCVQFVHWSLDPNARGALDHTSGSSAVERATFADARI